MSADGLLEWLGKSKMMDSSGAPQLFFHKSRSKIPFTEFKNEGTEKNPYNKHAGFWFAKPEDRKYIDHLGDGVCIYAYLKIENPFIIYDALGGIIGKIQDMDGVSYPAINPTQDFCQGLIKRGFDGLVIENARDYNQYVAFYPEQIKIIETK